MCLFALTLVPEVFLYFSAHERAARKLFFLAAPSQFSHAVKK